MTSFIESIGLVFGWVSSQAADILNLIIENPLLILMIPGFIIVGYVVSWVGKLIHQ